MGVPLPVVIEKRGDSERVYDLYSRLLKDRIIFLGTAINDEVANAVIAQLLFLESEDPNKDICMYINSPGGVITSGLGIYDTMQYVKPDIRTVCVGRAMSMGCFLLAGGTPGKRYALPNSTIMMHMLQGGTGGGLPDIRNQFQEMERLQNRLFGILASHSKRPIEELSEAYEREKYMDAQVAIEYGIIDHVYVESPRDGKEDADGTA